MLFSFQLHSFPLSFYSFRVATVIALGIPQISTFQSSTLVISAKFPVTISRFSLLENRPFCEVTIQSNIVYTLTVIAT